MSKISLLKQIVFICAFMCISALFSGCITTGMQTKTTTAQSIFLDPVDESQKIIYIAIRNTSGYDVNLVQKLESELAQKGYKVTKNPSEATFILQANVLKCDIKQEANASSAATIGAITGAGVGVYNKSSATAGVIGGVAGAAVGGLLGKLTEDTILQMQVDINIRQKANEEVLTNSGQARGQARVADNRRAGFTNSFGGPVRDTQGGGELYDNTQNYNQQFSTKDYLEYQTTLLAEATKMNLQINEAIIVLENQIVRQISGIF